jgi:hypothetical protein
MQWYKLNVPVSKHHSMKIYTEIDDTAPYFIYQEFEMF